MWRRFAMSLALGAVLMLSQHSPIARAAADPLQGAWQVVDATGRPGTGLYIFMAKHYSMMVATADRPDVADVSQATVEQLRALYGPMAANAGTYDVAGNLVTIRPIVAKIPVVMKPGAYEVYAFSVQDNTLTLTQQRNVRGPVEGRAPTKLVRVE